MPKHQDAVDGHMSKEAAEHVQRSYCAHRDKNVQVLLVKVQRVSRQCHRLDSSLATLPV